MRRTLPALLAAVLVAGCGDSDTPSPGTIKEPSWGRVGRHTVYKAWPFDAAEAQRRQQETANALGVSVEQEVDLGGGVTLTMVLIPAGEFLMGSAEGAGLVGERPQHRVIITKPFWLGKHEVTQAEWQAVVPSNPSRFKGDTKPVDMVSWDDVQGFLRRLNAGAGDGKFSLPTEAQWEYACRAGATTAYGFGDDRAQLGECAWFEDNSGKETHDVGQKKPNAWGLYDMHGNVFEWCQDRQGEYAAGARTDPTGPTTGKHRIIRGGSWHGSAGFCRSACRNYNPPDTRYAHYGFRLARPLP